jgi:hypothetical protein
MTVGWVAASTRGRALARRLVGVDRARVLAGLDWPQARQSLMSTMYGKDLAVGAGRDEARRASMEATSWQLRVLAGWLPPGNGSLARLFAAPLEMANIAQRVAALAGEKDIVSPIPLGSLAVAWPRVARATSGEALRTVLAASVWGDPGAGDRASLALGLQLGWARRLAGQSPLLERWAKGGAAVAVARERFGFERTLNDPTARVADALLGKRWRTSASVPELAQRLAPVATWPLAEIDEPSALWQAESAVARRVAADAGRLVSSGGMTRDVVVGAMALLLTDLRRVLAVIELAGRGPNPVEVFDAVA